MFEYYKQLIANNARLSDVSSTAVKEAEKLYPMINFYENQFKYLRQSQDGNRNLHFLHTLKLCYELGLARDLDLVQELQEAIFHSHAPTEPTQELSSWIYFLDHFIRCMILPERL